MDSQTAYELGGINTLTFKDGRWRGHTQSALNPPDCGGTYSVEAGRFSLRDDQCGPSHVVMTARWKLEDGELTFFDIRVGRPLEWGSKPFKKIGWLTLDRVCRARSGGPESLEPVYLVWADTSSAIK